MPISEDKNSVDPEALPDKGKPTADEPASRELGGRDGPDPTRFGDWELRGRCIDF
jgi:hypothetical protein